MSETRPLKTRRVKLDALHVDPSNVNTHPERNLEQIRGSLRQFGQVEPLVVQKSTGKVIGGNGRLEVMKALGWTECDVVELGLSNTEATALGIALNRTAETSERDPVRLAEVLQALQSEDFDLDAVGFNAMEVGELFQGIGDGVIGGDESQAPDEFPEYDEDIETEYRCPKCSFEWSGKPK